MRTRQGTALASNLVSQAPHEATFAALAKALGHPARIGIVSMLHERQTCIGCDIVEEIGLAQSTTSEHLRLLKAAGIITGEIDGPRVCYSLNPVALEPLRHFLNGLVLNRLAGGLADGPAAEFGSERGPK
jgi:ArsR family transcriptional regulator